MMPTISFRGDVELWRQFAIRAKQRRQRIWAILRPVLEDYLNEVP